MRGSNAGATPAVRRAVFGLTTALAVVAAVGGAPAGAAARRPASRVGIGGALAPRGAQGLTSRGRRSATPSATAATDSDLVYHGGDVMRKNTTYAIYWVPKGRTMSSTYRANVDRYFTDVAADSGATSNVYAVQTQYYDTSGPISYSQTFGGSVVVHKGFPKNGCPRYGGMAVCLTDKQIAAQVANVVVSRGWPTDTEHAYFLFLPKNVGTCVDRGGQACAFTQFCAYHSGAYLGGQPMIYANEPYAETKKACTLPATNDNPADSTINTTSHEHREMINDPLLDAWYDKDGEEGADKCAWQFGTTLGSSTDGPYNQVINGHAYYLQLEWSNADHGCELAAP